VSVFLVVVPDKTGEHPLQMRFVDGVHMIQQFAPTAPKRRHYANARRWPFARPGSDAE
jgi:hypothetical protein